MSIIRAVIFTHDHHFLEIAKEFERIGKNHYGVVFVEMNKLMGIISQEKASEIAGLTRAEFIFSLGKFGISPFQYTGEEIKEEISHE